MKQHRFGAKQYEAHVNLGEMDEVHSAFLPQILSKIGFKTTDIVTVPIEGLEQEDFHTIITTNGGNLKELTERVVHSVEDLKGCGYTVNRYKIESTIFDSNFNDQLNLL